MVGVVARTCARRGGGGLGSHELLNKFTEGYYGHAVSLIMIMRERVPNE
jgi:hypothetical protein